MSTLKTEKNTVSMGRIVRAAAYNAGLGHIGDLNQFFEHGQWWVENRRTGGQWSACDSEGIGSFNGFCFEQITRGEE